jgi:ABC-2 type transport system permease protein
MMREIAWPGRYYWSLRRELWEHPSVLIAPTVAAAVALLGVAVGRLAAPAGALPLPPYDIVIGVVMLTAYIVAVFYSLDALYGERRDRSILFWKSLPVSDATAVVAKLSVPLLLLPLLTYIVTVLALLVMVPLTRVHPPLMRTSALLLYHLVTVHSLWWAPLFGWLFLVSAAARRAPFVWATVPLVVIGLVERIAFGTSHAARVFGTRFTASPEAIVAHGALPTDPMTRMVPEAFVADPGLWIGFVLCAVLVAAAVRLRRRNGPS